MRDPVPASIDMASYVYILASAKNGTLYVGVSSDIVKRISQHKQKCADGFTKKYNITRLVYYEVFEDITFAIAREKVLKKWKRDWKIALIEKNNQAWGDLFEEICS